MSTRRGFLGGLAACMFRMPGASATDALTDAPILDVKAVPLIGAPGRIAYARFLRKNLPRAFAVGSAGAFGYQADDAETLDDARSFALSACRDAGGADAAIYAENLDVVWHGRASQTTLPPPALLEDWNRRFVPDVRYIWRGSARARGLYVWSHGTGGGDSRGLQPPPHVRLFNNAGYDIVRFDRHPASDDRDRAGDWLREGLRELRARGWRQIVAGGHSRGAWNSLQVLDDPGCADAVIAESPAAHGIGGSLFMTAQSDDLRRIVDNAPPSHTRVVFIQFRDDPYIGSAERRLALIGQLRAKTAGVLVIDRPDGFEGHLAAAGDRFADQFGDEILAFVRAGATDVQPVAR